MAKNKLLGVDYSSPVYSVKNYNADGLYERKNSDLHNNSRAKRATRSISKILSLDMPSVQISLPGFIDYTV